MDRPTRPTRPNRQIKHFEAKKSRQPYRFLKSNIPFLTQNSINGKSLNWTPTGYALRIFPLKKSFQKIEIDFFLYLPKGDM